MVQLWKKPVTRRTNHILSDLGDTDVDFTIMFEGFTRYILQAKTMFRRRQTIQIINSEHGQIRQMLQIPNNKHVHIVQITQITDCLCVPNIRISSSTDKTYPRRRKYTQTLSLRTKDFSLF